MDAEELNKLLIETNYPRKERIFLYQGFTTGFDIGYDGPSDVRQTAHNLKFRGVGDKVILWNKVMKEVGLKRYAGPFTRIPFDTYIQSPIGLVLKDGGKDVRLIFHLSYPKGGIHPSTLIHRDTSVQ